MNTFLRQRNLPSGSRPAERSGKQLTLVNIVETRDKDALARFFQQNVAAHVYALADLDEPFWHDVRAFVAKEGASIKAGVLLLDLGGTPMLYAVGAPEDPWIAELLNSLRSEIPIPCGVALPSGVGLSLGWHIDPIAECWKMCLRDDAGLDKDHDYASLNRLGPADLAELQEFFANEAYAPGEGGFFRSYMLELGPYFGLRSNQKLVAAGGVHVLSQNYRVAGIGNIATAPESRGKGFARMITQALCSELMGRGLLVGLNVRLDNAPALKCYRQVGFEPVLTYEEGWLRATSR
jgi:GNAT superfamily N-acetyltransferase